MTLCLLLAVHFCFGQTFTEMPRQAPFEGTDRGDINFADVDGDNDQDVLITGSTGVASGCIASLYDNDGAGNYTKRTNTPFVGISNGSTTFTDVDGDNDLDVFITGNEPGDANTRLYLNDGTGNFTERTQLPFSGDNRHLAVADVDGDGDPDVLLSGVGRTRLYTNDGSGIFTLTTTTNFSGIGFVSALFADVDNDGDSDILFQGSSIEDDDDELFKLYINDGGGGFAERTNVPFESTVRRAPVFVDVDNDNDLDLVVAEKITSVRWETRLYRNNGQGFFPQRDDLPLAAVGVESFMAAADVDGDGDQDLLALLQTPDFNNNIYILVNDGSGNFTARDNPEVLYSDRGYIALADVDGDNDVDVLVSGINLQLRLSTILYTNDGTGNFFQKVTNQLTEVSGSYSTFSDLDADGDQDLVHTGTDTSGADIIEFYFNNGEGVLNKRDDPSLRTEGFRGSVVAVSAPLENGRAHRFIMTPRRKIGSGSVETKMYITFREFGISDLRYQFEDTYSSTVKFSDVNGDGRQDFLLGGIEGLNTESLRLYIGDEDLVTGFTEKTNSGLPQVISDDFVFTDIDSDGDPDLFITRSDALPTMPTLYINDSRGNFTRRDGGPFDFLLASSVALLDANGDGHEDILHFGLNFGVGFVTNLYVNDGTGTFSKMNNTSFIGGSNVSIATPDIDGDGDQDILTTDFISDAEGALTYLYINDGAGSFTIRDNLPFAREGGSHVAAADLDNDNDQDILIIGFDSMGNRITKIYLNDGPSTAVTSAFTQPTLQFTPYPNPTKADRLQLNYEAERAGKVAVSIYTADGSLVSQQATTTVTGSQTLTVNIQGLKGGSYFVELIDGQRSGYAKFLVQ